MPPSLSGTTIVTSGMCGLWDPTHFPMVYDAEGWEDQFGSESDVLRHVRGGYFVPVRLNCPGRFDFRVRVGTAADPARPDTREMIYLAATSRDYLFRSSGWLCFGDYRLLEAVASDRVGVLALDPGEYVAQVHILAGDEEEGAVDAEGHRQEGALPDLLILLNPAPPGFEAPATLQSFP